MGEVGVGTGLAEWLLDQLAEDERLARGARLPGRPEGWRVDHEPWETNGTGIVDDAADSVAVAVGPRVAEHVVRWDPARVLVECDTKRRIIEMYRKAAAAVRAGSVSARNRVADETAWSILDDVLCEMSVVYKAREGYRAEWAPDGR